METVRDFIFLGSKITADGDCSHEIKRCLLLGRKAMTNLESILKTRDITLPTKVCLVKAMVFSGVIYECESWTIKKAECQRIDAFKLWCWRRLLDCKRYPLDCKEIQPIHSEGDQPWDFLGRSDAQICRNFLMKVKVESEKVGLQLNIQKTKIMVSGPITSWKIDGKTVETVADFILVGLQSHYKW